MDLSELTSFVEAHPDDHDQRWRLAKKLYMDCEYRQALEHLLVLRHAWRPRVNLTRYIAATYYRLGRYDEALKELGPALERWPSEIALREQVARVFEVTGRTLQALDAWREIRASNESHPMAARAIQRLEAMLSEDAPEEIPIGDSDSGLDIGGLVCAVCGAQNSVEFSRCWQCHALLDERAAAATPAPITTSAPRTRTDETADRLVWIIAAVAVAVLALDVYLTLSHLARLNLSEPRGVLLSLRAVLEYEFAFTRIGIGIGLALLWPVAIALAIKVVEVPGAVNASVAVVTGLLAAAITYLTTWAPGLWWLAAPVVGAALTFALMWHYLEGPPRLRAAAWMLHGALVAAAALTGFVAFQGFAPLMDTTALIRFAGTEAASEDTGIYHGPDLLVDRPVPVVWESSGSDWLDSLPLVVRFRLLDAPPDKPLYVELLENGRVLAGRNVDGPRVEFTETPIVSGNDYVLHLHGVGDAPPVRLQILSLHRPRFGG